EMSTDNKLYNAFHIAQVLETQGRKEPLDADEQAEMDQWLAASDGNRSLFERLSDENQLAFDVLALQDRNVERELVKMRNKLQRVARKRTRLWYAAATLLLSFSVGLSIYWGQIRKEQTVVSVSKDLNDILPGGN